MSKLAMGRRYYHSSIFRDMRLRRGSWGMMRSSFLPLAFVAFVAACANPPADDAADTVESGISTASRLADLRTDTVFFRRYGASPSAPIAVGARSFFFATKGRTTIGGASERGLYATDGTPAGTSLVTNVADGPRAPASFAGSLYFARSRPIAGTFRVEYDLVRSDGSGATTFAVSPFAKPGTSVEEIAPSGTSLYVTTIEEQGAAFVARLSKLTRNAGGTDSVESLSEIPLATRDFVSAHVVANANGVLFAANGTLVRSDGTVAGSVVVATGRKTGSLTATSTRFFFTEPSATISGATELFEVIDASPRTRGYGAVTGLVRVAPFGDGIVVISKDALWTVDTKRGTLASHPHAFGDTVSTAVLGTKLHALDRNGVIVTTDGTVTTENHLAEQPSWLTTKPATELVAHAGALYFIQTINRARQIVRVDAAKTIVSSFPPGAELENLRSIGGLLYVAAGGYGKELYSWNGATFSRLEVNEYGNASSNAAPVIATPSRLFLTVDEDVDWFANDNGTEQSLYVSDGTAAGTTKLRSGLYSFYTSRYRTPAAVSVASRACILEQAAFRMSIVCSDGTAGGTTTDAYAYEGAPVALGDGVFYSRWGAGGNGQDVVRFDGTTGARTVLASLAKGSVVQDIVARDSDVVFFVDSSDAASRGIWTSDGTPAGTIRMVPNVPFIGEGERVIGRIGKDVYVTGAGSLHKTDGSATGTVLVSAIPYAGPPSFPRAGVIGTKIVFPVDHALWVSEGTPATTFELLKGDSFYDFEAEGDGRVAFSSGSAIVVTDGTRGGTSRQIVGRGSPGAVGALAGKGFVVSSYDAKDLYLVNGATSAPLETGRGTYMNLAPLALNGGLVFPGPLDGKGTEILFSDGTPNGTRVVADVAPGALSSDPSRLYVGRGRLWFTAEDSNGDRELYSLPVAAVP
jgi:ELWxxDGT repeat protein